MRRFAGLFLALTFLLPGCASSSVDLIEPELRIAQMPGTTFSMRYAGRLEIRYALQIENLAAEPIELQRVQLRVFGEGPYELQNRAIPVRQKIAPESTEVVRFTAAAYSFGGQMAPKEPVTLRGIAHFDSPQGRFRTIFTQIVLQPDDTLQ